MHRSSDSIASLAAALAKAQAELVNPEKSLVATIRPEVGSTSERSFRYAPLSSGLDIVRKTLGQHDIATVQTTAIDQTAGMVNLTTVLAHSSGEWIASDWPVCAIADTATPHRMGAALTYARRYALFTLVGIAGEDDVDAPDLLPPEQPAPKRDERGRSGRLNGGRPHGQAGGQRANAVDPRSAGPTLDPEASAALCDRLVIQLEALSSDDDAAVWAHRSLPEKNRLMPAHAQRVEEAFQARVITFAMPTEAQPQTMRESVVSAPAASRPMRLTSRARAKGIDKSRLSLPEPRRIRDRDHVRYVAQQPCLICGRSPSDAHHLRFAQPPALGRKVSDEFTVPLCRGHHREVHRCGDEEAWWVKTKINPRVIARVLWLGTHPLGARSEDTPIAAVGS